MTASEAPPVRIGVIGAGFMGRQHLDFIQAAPDAALTAVADPAPSRARSTVRPIGAPQPCSDAEDLDAVIIANPNPLHVDTAIECLEAGVAVLLEKPVAVDYAQSLRLVDAVARLRGRLLVGHHRRHHPAIARARTAIHDGEIGQVVAVSGLWSARKEDAYFTDTPWHRQRGAGVMLINVVHDLDLLRHLCGEVAEIQAMQSSHARGLEVEDTVSLNLRFESGAVGSFLASDAGVSPWGWDQSTEETLAFPFLPDGVAYRLVGTRGALVGAQPREVLVRPVGVRRLALPPVAHLPPVSRRAGRSRRSSITSSRSHEGRPSPSSRPRMHRGRSRSLEAAALAARTGTHGRRRAIPRGSRSRGALVTATRSARLGR